MLYIFQAVTMSYQQLYGGLAEYPSAAHQGWMMQAVLSRVMGDGGGQDHNQHNTGAGQDYPTAQPLAMPHHPNHNMEQGKNLCM